MGMDIRSVGAINIAGLDTFDNLQYGIKAKETNLQVYNEEFQNIGFKAGYGIGVDDSGSTGSSGGYTLTVESNSFLGSFDGVVASKQFSSVTINYNIMYDSASTAPTYGIITSGSMATGNVMTINKNKINNTTIGISCILNSTTKAQIDTNIITITGNATAW